MNSTFIKNLITAIAGAVLIFSVASCVKEKFAAPPTQPNSDPPGLHATMTIAQFKNAYYYPNRTNPLPFQIKDSVILSGVVNGDDRTGNLYKQIIFQDSTGGLQIAANVSDLYNYYPQGTRIFVKCKGLYFYNYLGTLELGSYIDTVGSQPSLGGIPTGNLSTYVVRGMTGLTIVPKHYTVFSLNNGADPIQDQSTLVQVDSVEFTSATDTMTYADAVDKSDYNLMLSDCASPVPNTVIVRTSGYANFATSQPPKGHGSVLGIFTIYLESNGTTQNQLTIRDTTDVQFPYTNRICP